MGKLLPLFFLFILFYNCFANRRSVAPFLPDIRQLCKFFAHIANVLCTSCWKERDGCLEVIRGNAEQPVSLHLAMFAKRKELFRVRAF